MTDDSTPAAEEPEADTPDDDDADASEPDETLVPRDQRDRQPGRKPSGHGGEGDRPRSL